MKKPPIGVAIGLVKPKGDEPDGDEAGMDEESGDPKHTAAEALISAVEAKDAAQVARAFKALYDLCDEGESAGGEEEASTAGEE